MPEPPRRKRLQIHLSTALILMLAAGVLIWANATPRMGHRKSAANRGFPEFVEDRETLNLKLGVGPDNLGEPLQHIEQKYSEYGFPRTMRATVLAHYTFKSGRQAEATLRFPFIWLNVCINFAVALIILFTIWFMCEWWIRRREAKTET